MVAFLSGVLFFIFIVDVILLIPVVLMQSGSGAQAGLFGSDFASGAFGAKTSEVLVGFTKWLVALFFLTSLGLAYLHLPSKTSVRPAVNASETPPLQETEALPVELPQTSK